MEYLESVCPGSETKVDPSHTHPPGRVSPLGQAAPILTLLGSLKV